MKQLIPWIMILSFLGPVYGRRTVVTTASAINFGIWNAGDTIIMKNGTWNNQVISLKATGTSTNPIVIEAETSGKVILTGSSRLSFSGKYLVISGLYFLNGTLSGADVISFRTSSAELAEYCRLTQTAIVNYNPSSNIVDSKWVSIYGRYNQVDHCSFENKNNSGTLLVVWLKNDVPTYHNISGNYFGYRNPNLDGSGNVLNGQEIMRVGDSSTSMTTASVTVEGNFFEKCNGEIEVISNKSSGNVYTNNLFYECKGMLTLRHGNNCTVEGNYFIGNIVDNTGGVRIIGENHKVYNNYFQELKGTNFRSAICLVRGKENSALNEYFQVKNALVAFNTMVNCSQAFSINYNSQSGMTLPPVTSTIAHNHVYNNTAANINIAIDQTSVALLDVTWKNNLMNQGKYISFSFSGTQVITGVNPMMGLASTPVKMLEPDPGSPLLNYVTGDYPEVFTDIRGRSRENQAKWPGCSQIPGYPERNMPEKTKTGASFFNNPVTNLIHIEEENELILTLENQRLTIKTSLPREIRIYNLSGLLIARIKLSAHGTAAYDLQRGIYVIQSVSGGRRDHAKKILVL